MSTPPFLLDPQSLANKVPPATFARGLEVLRNQQVLECKLTGAGSQEWHVDGAVQGSRSEIYDVSVMLELSGDGLISFFTAECSCPVGHNCKHSIALTLKAAYKSGGRRMQETHAQGLGSPPTPKAPPRPAELQAQKEAADQVRQKREREQAEQKVTHWLDLFGDDAAPDATLENKDAADHLVFTLSMAMMVGQPVLQLGFGLTRRLKNGNWAKLKEPRHLSAANATGSDMEVVRLIESLASRTYSYPYSNSQGLIAGAAGLLALQLASHTGKLFASTEERVLGPAVRWGPTQTLAWRWSQATQGSATRAALARKAKKAGVSLQAPPAPDTQEALWKLTPQLPDAAHGAQCFANTPALYLHASAGVCGQLEMPGVSGEHLQLLMCAPPIPQSAFALHETTLLRRLAGLPLPPVLKAPEQVQGIKPTTCLHISAVAPDDQARLGLLRATLRFDYAGLPYYALHEHNPVLIEQGNPSNDKLQACAKQSRQSARIIRQHLRPSTAPPP